MILIDIGLYLVDQSQIKLREVAAVMALREPSAPMIVKLL
jgi:hypothetical protein